MLYEYRISQCLPNKKGVVHWRNAEYNRRLYERHGMDYVAAFDAVIGNSAYVHYMLRWSSIEERNDKWASYFADPEFREIAGRTGPLTRHVPNELWTLTPFSPILP